MVAVFEKVDKFSFIFLQMFGYSGDKNDYRRNCLA